MMRSLILISLFPCLLFAQQGQQLQKNIDTNLPSQQATTNSTATGAGNVTSVGSQSQSQSEVETDAARTERLIADSMAQLEDEGRLEVLEEVPTPKATVDLKRVQSRILSEDSH